MTSSPLSLLLDWASETGLHKNRENLAFGLNATYGDIDFQGKRVLDIGGGTGLVSFYAACRGAKTVVCLEPELAGSTSGVRDQFERTRDRLQLPQVVLESTELQSFDPGPHSFDIVILTNSINHLDEPACVALLTSQAARNSYLEIIRHLAYICAPGAEVVITDCSNKNVFPKFGLTNPFMRSIEWHKHHTPSTWTALLQAEGFGKPVVSWSSFNTLRGVGRFMLAHRPVAYFLMSHFRLKVTKC